MQTPAADTENEAGVIRGKSPLHQALEAVVKIERTKVITGPSDSVGVLLYNVDVSSRHDRGCQLEADCQSTRAPAADDGISHPKKTHVVQALRTISADEIKRLIKVLESADDEYAAQGDTDEPTTEPAILRETYPPVKPDEELNPADVLRACLYLFRDA